MLPKAFRNASIDELDDVVRHYRKSFVILFCKL